MISVATSAVDSLLPLSVSQISNIPAMLSPLIFAATDTLSDIAHFDTLGGQQQRFELVSANDPGLQSILNQESQGNPPSFVSPFGPASLKSTPVISSDSSRFTLTQLLTQQQPRVTLCDTEHMEHALFQYSTKNTVTNVTKPDHGVTPQQCVLPSKTERVLDVSASLPLLLARMRSQAMCPLDVNSVKTHVTPIPTPLLDRWYMPSQWPVMDVGGESTLLKMAVDKMTTSINRCALKQQLKLSGVVCLYFYTCHIFSICDISRNGVYFPYLYLFRADVVVCGSSFEKQILSKYFRINAMKTVAIPMIVRPTEYWTRWCVVFFKRISGLRVGRLILYHFTIFCVPVKRSALARISPYFSIHCVKRIAT